LLRLIENRPALILSVLFLLTIFTIVWVEARQQKQSEEESALEHARAFTQGLTEFRSLYTSEVVANLSGTGVEATHDYQEHGGVPLPATMTILLGQRLGEKYEGAQVALYSPFPFPWRESAGLRDDFGKDAWAALSRDPSTPFHRFETAENVRSLRYATADILRHGCVSCHNTHPDTPRTGWQVGDARGILEVRFPVAKVTLWTQLKQRNVVFLLLVTSVIGLLGIGVVVGSLRRRQRSLEATVSERTQELQSQAGTLESIIASVVEAVIVIDEAGKIQSANSATETMFLYTSAEMIGNNVSMLMPSPHRDEHDEYLRNYMKTGHAKIIGVGSRRLTAVRKDGSVFDIELSVSEARYADHRVFTGIVKDIRLQLAHERELERLSKVDPGTGLPNRRAFEDTLESEWRRCRRADRSIAVVMLDLDYFKLFNDHYGHVTGDRCLVQVAEALGDALGRGGDLAARFGGEEFILLLPEVDVEGARIVAERIRHYVEELGIPHRDHPSSPVVTISAGIASVVPTKSGVAVDLVESADQALYRAKQKGRNQVSD